MSLDDRLPIVGEAYGEQSLFVLLMICSFTKPPTWGFQLPSPWLPDSFSDSVYKTASSNLMNTSVFMLSRN